MVKIKHAKALKKIEKKTKKTKPKTTLTGKNKALKAYKQGLNALHTSLWATRVGPVALSVAMASKDPMLISLAIVTGIYSFLETEKSLKQVRLEMRGRKRIAKKMIKYCEQVGMAEVAREIRNEINKNHPRMKKEEIEKELDQFYTKIFQSVIAFLKTKNL